ncbi:MAG: hypothetical protein AAF518_14440, partial [Spirochaetota bacterium]
NLKDAEYDPFDKRVVLLKQPGNYVFIANINTTTGKLFDEKFLRNNPSDPHPSASGYIEMTLNRYKNGPEWGTRHGKTCIYFTKEHDGVIQIFRADWIGGTWIPTLTPVITDETTPVERGPVFASFNEPGLLSRHLPFIVYIKSGIEDTTGIREIPDSAGDANIPDDAEILVDPCDSDIPDNAKVFWKYDDGTNIEYPVSDMTYLGADYGSSIRIIPGQLAIVQISDIGSCIHEIQWTCLVPTRDEAPDIKWRHSFGVGKRARSCGVIRLSKTEYILYALVGPANETSPDADTIESFKFDLTATNPFAPGSVQNKTIIPYPGSGARLIDEENFVSTITNEPFISLVVKRNSTKEIWVVSAFDYKVGGAVGQPKLSRRISYDIGIKERKDPEPFLLDSGTFIYYLNDINSSTGENFHLFKGKTDL